MFQNVKERCSKFFDFLPENKRLIWVFFIISILILIFCLTVWDIYAKWNDVYLYFGYANNLFDGMVPYKDFVFEYPPFIIPFIAFPRLFTSDLQTYCTLFSIMTITCFIIGTIFMLKIAKLFGSTNVRILIFAALTLIMTNTYLIARYDIFPVTLCIVGIYFYLQKKYDYAWITIAIGTMTKLFPILFLPIFLIPLLVKKDYRNAMRGIILALAVAVIISLPFIISDLSSAFDYLSYHTDRGIQIESVAASIFLFIDIFYPGTVGMVFNYGSSNLTGPWPEAIAPLMMYFLLVAVLAFLSWLLVALYRKRESIGHENIEKILVVAGVTLFMIFIAFSKVFSAQFVIWILMLLALTQIGLFSTKDKNRILIIAIIYGVLSGFCGFFYDQIAQQYPSVITLLLIRNVLHVVFAAYLVHLLAKTINQFDPKDKKVGIRDIAHDLKNKIFH